MKSWILRSFNSSYFKNLQVLKATLHRYFLGVHVFNYAHVLKTLSNVLPNAPHTPISCQHPRYC